LVTYGKGLRTLSIATVVVLVGAFAMAAFYAPEDADQGIIQKIFYVHVPMALVALGGFVAGGVYAFKHLRSGNRSDDLKSYVAIHLSLVLAVGVLITGSIWAKGSWGAWWVWDEPMLVAFLIIFLLYATYQPLRFSIEDPERQARYASVFAVVAGVFVPINFAAVRLRPALDDPPAHRSTRPAPGCRRGDVHVPRRAGRHDAAVRDAVEVRDGEQGHARPGAVAAAAAWPASTAPTSRHRAAAPPRRWAPDARRRRLPRGRRTSSSSRSSSCTWRSWPSGSAGSSAT
jgi:heme exporter protein C